MSRGQGGEGLGGCSGLCLFFSTLLCWDQPETRAEGGQRRHQPRAAVGLVGASSGEQRVNPFLAWGRGKWPRWAQFCSKSSLLK